MIILLDFETTGLTLHPRADLKKQPKAIEFGGLLLDADGKWVEEASIMINPGEPITEEITKITGITNDDLKDAPTFAEVLPQIERMFRQARMVVAHNLNFDKQILMGELARLGRVELFPWPKQEMCTVQLYREDYGRNPRLIELYERVMGKPLAQTHRALDDVKAMAEVFLAEELHTFLLPEAA